MTDCVGTTTPSTAATATPPPAVPCNLLLVSGNQCWTRAVQEAVDEIGGGLSRCDARDAVIRLACITPHYSHLLLHPDSADGLLNELVTLTAGDRESSTEILLLGAQGQLPPWIGVIQAANRQVVRQALAPRAKPAPGGGMLLPELREALDGMMIETATSRSSVWPTGIWSRWRRWPG